MSEDKAFGLTAKGWAGIAAFCAATMIGWSVYEDKRQEGRIERVEGELQEINENVIRLNETTDSVEVSIQRLIDVTVALIDEQE